MNDATNLAPSGRLRECPDCGLFLSVPELAARTVARCPRCHSVLRRGRTDPIGRPLAMAATGLLLLLIAGQSSFVDLTVNGLQRDTTVFTGPQALQEQGMWEVAIVVLITTLLAPLARLLAILWVLAGLRLTRPGIVTPGLLGGAHLAHVFRWAETLRPWAMVEVFLLGLFVAYTRLIAVARVEIGAGVYAMAALMLVTAAVDASMDPDTVWQELERRQGGRDQTASDGAASTDLIGCDACGLVSLALVSPAGARRCPRCDARVRRRKPASLGRTWALTLAAGCLYLPANMLPVLTLIRAGRGGPSTILGGAEELLAAGMWPLALLVFVASIMVPVLKLVGLTIMLVSTQRHWAAGLQERTLIYRVVDVIGRWSMIDVFMISILTAVVRMGTVASVYPGDGAIAFCGVVILTIFAANSFDPRLMWDAAGQRA